MINGVVRGINYRTGHLAVELEAAEYVILEADELLEEVDVGDVLSGELTQHGPASLRDMTRGFDFPARIQAIGATAAERDLLLRD